jgi:NAD(P)-dependent dehydrogenase (short-subunit alcohol dehydrogenase family)
MKTTWLITGVSSGLGKSLAEAVMRSGDMVIATFRTPAQAEAFTAQYPESGFGLVMDITKNEEILAAWGVITKKFGRIDVLVNNAGVGFVGAVEEASVDEVRRVFEANVFGTLLLTQTVLPMLRAQKSGHIVQISSHGGIKAFPGFGVYNASKFALEGFSEALAAEIAPLGVKVSIIEPGPFRTNFAGTSLLEAAQILDDYAATAGTFRKRMKEVVNGNQEGDPDKAALAIVEMVKRAATTGFAPLRLPLGKTALATISAKIDSVKNDLEAAREVAESVVYSS